MFWTFDYWHFCSWFCEVSQTFGNSQHLPSWSDLLWNEIMSLLLVSSSITPRYHPVIPSLIQTAIVWIKPGWLDEVFPKIPFKAVSKVTSLPHRVVCKNLLKFITAYIIQFTALLDPARDFIVFIFTVQCQPRLFTLPCSSAFKKYSHFFRGERSSRC